MGDDNKHRGDHDDDEWQPPKEPPNPDGSRPKDDES